MSFFLKRSFQRAARMSSININDESFKFNFFFEKKNINFLKMLAEHISNKKN